MHPLLTHPHWGARPFLLLCWGWAKQGEFTTPGRWFLLVPWLQTEAEGKGSLDFWKGLKELISFPQCFWRIAISKLAMLVTLIAKKSKKVEFTSPVYGWRHRLGDGLSEFPPGEAGNCVQLSCTQIPLHEASHFCSFWKQWFYEPSLASLCFHCHDRVPWKCFVAFHAWPGL